MKKSLLVAITTLAVLLALTATAERKIWLYSHDGNHVSLPVEKLDSISFEEPGMIFLNPEKKLLDYSGGRFSLTILANKAWTATVSDPTALTISKTSGTGNDNISVLAQSNADEKSYTSFVKFTLSDGTCRYLYVTVAGKMSEEEIAIELGKVYSHLQREFGYVYRQGYWSLQENSTDECVVPTRYLGDWLDANAFWVLHNHRFTPTTRELDQYGISAFGAFAMPYNGIAKANNMLKQMKEDGSDKLHPEIVAELKVFRAWYHMLLMDVFGRVGFYTENTDLSGNHPQYDRWVVCDSIMKDLITNVPLLKKEKHCSYNVISDDEVYNYCRINQYVGKMIMAKMYLNAEVWGVVGMSKEMPSSATDCYKKVVELCDDIINNGGYSLEPNYFDNFKVDNENSKENMWSVYYDANLSKGMQFHMLTLHYKSKESYGLKETPWNGYCTTHKVLGLYEKNDTRLASWERGQIKTKSGNDITVTFAVDKETYQRMPKYVRKPKNWPATMPDSLNRGKSMTLEFPAYYTDTVTTLTNTEEFKVYNIFEGARFCKFQYQEGLGVHMSNDFPIYRLADVYLMKAEACLRGGGSVGDAVAAANMVRNRAGATQYNMSTLTLDELCNERVRELCWEGHRRTDLIRFGRFTGANSLPNESDPANLWVLRTSESKPYDVGDNACKPSEATPTPDYMKICPIPQFMIDYGYTQNPGY